MQDCIICKLTRKEVPVKVVEESGDAVAMLDVNPVAPGHTFVVPKRHVFTILELSDNEIANLFSMVKRVTDRIKNALNCDGFNIGINHGKAGGSMVPHLHVHVIPRFEGDKGGSMHTIVRNPPTENLDAIFLKIKNASTSEPAPETNEEETVQQIIEEAPIEEPAKEESKPEPVKEDVKEEPKTEEPKEEKKKKDTKDEALRRKIKEWELDL